MYVSGGLLPPIGHNGENQIMNENRLMLLSVSVFEVEALNICYPFDSIQRGFIGIGTQMLTEPKHMRRNVIVCEPSDLVVLST